MSASASTAKEVLARLVAFDTTSSKTNIPLVEFVEAYLAGHGIESRRVPTAARASTITDSAASTRPLRTR